MNKLIDMHCHILPGVDDGSADIETTRKMLEIAWQDGITDMIATPHFQPGRFTATAEDWKREYEIVKEEAKRVSEDFMIHLGSELLGLSTLEQQLEEGCTLTMCGSQYVLIEFYPEVTFEEVTRTMSRVMQYGYWPILAHVERYACLRRNPVFVENLIDMGVYIQANAGSIMGKAGWVEKFFTRKLLKYEMIHFIGTDAHSANHRRPEMKECIAYIEKKYGTEYAKKLAYEHAEQMMKNKIIR